MSTETKTKEIKIRKELTSQVVEIKLTGKLEKADYKAIVPEFERLIQKHGKIRLIVILEDFHGWKPGALWEDIKFDAKHFNDVSRIAFVGDKKWEEGMATFCKPFTTAKVKFFPHEQLNEARNWTESE